MTAGFWAKLNKPIMALAPMANVTDAAFRRIIAKYGKPNVLWTEFVSADGLSSRGREKLLIDLAYSQSERPIVAQLFSGKPEKMYEAAKLVKELKFDGLDINMGCPDRAIEKSGAGAALIKDFKRAREIIRAAKEGASGLPISLKTRLGYNKDILDEWLPELLAESPAAIIIHGRTRKEMSDVPARWERIKRAVEIRDAFFSRCPSFRGEDTEGEFRTLILGNGDVKDVSDARQKVEDTGADGIMLGRAIFGNPWLFADAARIQQSDCCTDSQTVVSRLGVLVEHTKLFEELLGDYKNFANMKKHFKAYVEGFDGAKELRMKLMETESAAEVAEVVASFLGSVSFVRATALNAQRRKTGDSPRASL